MKIRHSYPLALAILVALGAYSIWIAPQNGPAPPIMGKSDDRIPDPRYFYPLPDRADRRLMPGDAAMQVKGVAAHRHVPVGDVRQLLDECTVGRGHEPLGRQFIDLDRLNRALDSRWPGK